MPRRSMWPRAPNNPFLRLVATELLPPDASRHTSDVSEGRSRGRPRDNARVETAVVEATLAEIEEKGLGNCTVEAIAARAGIGKATFYRRWPNKEAVLYFLASQLSDVIEPIDTGNLRKDLLSVFEPLPERVYGGPVATVMPTFIAEAARDPQMRKFVAELTEERRKGAIHALQRARRRGELRRGVDLDTVVDMMTGAFACRALLLGEPITGAFARKVVDLAINGIVKQ
jgi:AcrR family transcriptional regulator